MRVSAIIEARMNSSRLPGKGLLPILGKPMLEKLVERLRKCAVIDTLLLLTPDDSQNQPLWNWATTQPDLKVHAAPEPERDVLAHVVKAARDTQTDIICEVTGDCPLIDPFIVDLITGYIICGEEVCVNCEPRTWPQGMEVRAFRTETLERSCALTLGNTYHRENVSTFLYSPESPFDWRNILAPESETVPKLNLSVDTEEDYKRVKDIFETLEPTNPNFTCSDILQYLGRLPTYYDMINKPQIWKPAAWLATS